MEEPVINNGDTASNGLQIIRYSPYRPCTKFSLPWLDLRVFYVRISDFVVDDSTPEFLTLNHIPLSPDTLLEVNGVRSNMYSEGISSLLRRDRMDKKTEEATFVTTDSIRLTGNVKFEVYNKEDLILSGLLEISHSNGFTSDSESRNNGKQWKMNCEAEITAGSGFLKGKHVAGPESPAIEVYVAGSFAGTPIILTKSMQLSLRKKYNKKGTLDAIPEYEATDSEKDVSSELDYQGMEYRNYKHGYDEDYQQHMSWRTTEYLDGEDGELSWFNAGVRVGVGIGLGICVGAGIGVGLLVRTYQSTTRNFRRRLL